LGVAVTAVPLAPLSIVCGVVPVIFPPAPATYVNVTLSTGKASNVAVYVASAWTFESVLTAVVLLSLHFTNLYPEFGVAVELMLPLGTTLFFPGLDTLPPAPAV